MKERQKIEVPKDNYGRLYIGLLESPLSSTAKLCYGVMWSFGFESWASADSIARRMGMHRNSVGPAQAELEKAGWIQLLEAKQGTPKHWVMKTPTTIVQVDAQPLGSTPTAIVHPPAQPLGSKQEGKQELKQEGKQEPVAKAGKHPDQDAFWKFAQPTFKAITGQTLSWPRTPTFQKQITEGLSQHGSIELCRRWDNYLTDPYAQSRSLLGFFYDLDKWITRREKLPTGGTNARAFVQPKTDWQPSGKTAPH